MVASFVHSTEKRTEAVRIDLDQCGKDHLLKSLDGPQLSIYARAGDQLLQYAGREQSHFSGSFDPQIRLIHA